MIVIRANHDTQTNYLFLWSRYIIRKLKGLGFNVVKIEGPDINESTLRSRVKKHKPKFIFFNGHGSDDALYNNKKESFIDSKSSDIFKNTVVFTRACSCLTKLGNFAVKNEGCLAFIGYRKPFWLARDPKYECQPLKDKIVKPIIESSNVVIKELIKSKTVSEAVKKSHEKSADYILELIYSKEPLAGATLQALVVNDFSLDFEGDPSAKIC